MARSRKGLAPGNAEIAPVPFAPPAAVPSALPANRSTGQVRCDGLHPRRKGERCNALLAEAPPFTGSCWRCGQGHTEAVADDARLRRIEEAVASFRATPAPVVNVHPADVNVHPADIHIHPPANSVTFKRGAFEGATPVTIKPTVVNVTTPEVRNEITVESAAVTVEPTPVQVDVHNDVAVPSVEVRNEITVEPTPVTVEPPVVTVTNEVAAPKVNVRAEMPASMSMQITSMPDQRMRITALPAQKRRVTKRDPQGRIVEVSEEPQ